jgi:iron complex transport system substrate-binding protein
MAVAYKSHYELVAAAGITTEVTYVCDMVGYSGGKYGDYSQWYPQYKDAKCFGNRATPDYEVFTDNPPSCFITGTKTSYAKTAEENLNKLGVDIVRLPAYENGWAVPAMLMLGFLTGHEDTASKYVEKADYVYNTIEAHVKDIPMSQRPYVFIHHNATQVSKYGSGVIETAVLAGASTPIDRGFPAGKVDAEAVALTMNPEWIVLEPWHGVLETTDGSVDATFAWDLDNLYNKDKAGIQAIDHTQAYKDGKVLMFTQGVRFGPSSYIATAYIANHIYPGVFNFDVEGLFNDYMKTYHPEVNAKEWFEYTYFDLEFAEKHHNASA